MIKLPTSRKFLIKKLEETQPNENRPPTPQEVEKWMIEFAEMHLKKAGVKNYKIY